MHEVGCLGCYILLIGPNILQSRMLARFELQICCFSRYVVFNILVNILPEHPVTIPLAWPCHAIYEELEFKLRRYDVCQHPTNLLNILLLASQQHPTRVPGSCNILHAQLCLALAPSICAVTSYPHHPINIPLQSADNLRI